MRLRHWFAVAVAVAFATAWPGAASAQEATVLAVEQRTTSVTALDDVAAWSSYDPAIDRYRLVASTAGGHPERLPVPSRSVPFDADLGRGEDGQPVLAYSRCRLETEGHRGQILLPDYAGAEGCRLYRYRLGARRERRIRMTRRPRTSEFLPSVWRGRAAFMRKRTRPGQGLLTGGGRRRLVVRSLRSGRERVVALPRGPVGRTGERIPAVVDLAGSRLLSGWEYLETECRRPFTWHPEDKIGPEGSEVYRGTASRMRRIAVGCSNDPVQAVIAPAQLGRLSFSLDVIDRDPYPVGERRTYSPSGEVIATGPIPADGANALAVARSGVYFGAIAWSASTGYSYPIVRTPR